MVLSLAVQGCGVACFQVAYLELVMAATPAAQRGVAGSLGMLTRTIGTVTGASVLTLGFQTIQSIALADGEAAPDAFLTAYHAMFRLAGHYRRADRRDLAWSAVAGRTSSGGSHGILNRAGSVRAISDRSAFAGMPYIWENGMSDDHVYRVIEITGSSPKSIDDAIQVAVARASKTCATCGGSRWSRPAAISTKARYSTTR